MKNINRKFSLRPFPLFSLPHIGAAEWRFVALAIVAMLAFTSAPYVYAYLSAPADKVFMGIVLNPLDHGQYFSWLREFTHANLINNKLTSEPNPPLFFNLLWWMLARISQVTGANHHVMYQLMRVLGATFFFWGVYRLSAFAFNAVAQRKLALITTALTCGFGWVLIVMKYTITGGELINPLDVFMAEGNTMLSLMGYPHFIAAANYIWAFDFFLRAQATGQKKYVVASGLAALFLGWQHGYDLFIVWGVIAAYILLKSALEKKLALAPALDLVIIGAISFSPGLYSFALIRLDPMWKEVLAQFANGGVYTPPVWRLPVLMGLAFLIAVATTIAAVVAHRKTTPRTPAQTNSFASVSARYFFYAWFLVSFGLVYMPTDFQVHMLNGWQVPIAIIATHGLYDFLIPFLASRKQSWLSKFSTPQIQAAVIAIFVLGMLPTNLYLWAWRFTELRRHEAPFFITRDELQAMSWIEQHAQPEDAVLCSLNTGAYLPMQTGVHAYLAHWAQTLHFKDKQANVNAFFAPATSDEKRLALLQADHVNYVFYGPSERALGTHSPATLSALQLVFTKGDVEVYALKAHQN